MRQKPCTYGIAKRLYGSWEEVEQALQSKPKYPVNRAAVKLDGIWRGGASYPGMPSGTGVLSCQEYHKTKPRRRLRSGSGCKADGKITSSTDDSGLEKLGNRVEDKTLKTRETLVWEECLWQRTRWVADGHILLTRDRSSSLDALIFAGRTWQAMHERRL